MRNEDSAGPAEMSEMRNQGTDLLAAQLAVIADPKLRGARLAEELDRARTMAELVQTDIAERHVELELAKARNRSRGRDGRPSRGEQDAGTRTPRRAGDGPRGPLTLARERETPASASPVDGRSGADAPRIELPVLIGRGRAVLNGVPTNGSPGPARRESTPAGEKRTQEASTPEGAEVEARDALVAHVVTNARRKPGRGQAVRAHEALVELCKEVDVTAPCQETVRRRLKLPADAATRAAKPPPAERRVAPPDNERETARPAKPDAQPRATTRRTSTGPRAAKNAGPGQASNSQEAPAKEEPTKRGWSRRLEPAAAALLDYVVKSHDGEATQQDAERAHRRLKDLAQEVGTRAPSTVTVKRALKRQVEARQKRPRPVKAATRRRRTPETDPDREPEPTTRRAPPLPKPTWAPPRVAHKRSYREPETTYGVDRRLPGKGRDARDAGAGDEPRQHGHAARAAGAGDADGDRAVRRNGWRTARGRARMPAREVERGAVGGIQRAQAAARRGGEGRTASDGLADTEPGRGQRGQRGRRVTAMKERRPGLEVGRMRRLRDGSGACEVRIPCDHALAVRCEDQDGNEFTVDYTITYVTGPGRTIVRRKEPGGEWSGRLTGTLEPVRRISDSTAYARPENLERVVRNAWRQRERATAKRPAEARAGLFD